MGQTRPCGDTCLSCQGVKRVWKDGPSWGSHPRVVECPGGSTLSCQGVDGALKGGKFGAKARQLSGRWRQQGGNQRVQWNLLIGPSSYPFTCPHRSPLIPNLLHCQTLAHAQLLQHSSTQLFPSHPPPASVHLPTQISPHPESAAPTARRLSWVSHDGSSPSRLLHLLAALPLHTCECGQVGG